MTAIVRSMAVAAAVLMVPLASCATPQSGAEDHHEPESTAGGVESLGGEENAAYLDDLYSRAVDAGQTTITVYGITATSSASLYEAFMKRYPDLTVDHVTIFGAELQQRIASEQATGQFAVDNLSVSGSDAVYVADQGFVAEQKPPLAPKLPETYRPVGDRLFGGNTYLYTVSYNTDLVPAEDAPKSFDDLLDPKWAGKIGMPDPNAGANGFVFAAVKAGVIDESWLEKFKATNPVILPSERDVFTAVSTGQVELGLGNYVRGQAFLETDGLPVGFVADFTDGVSDGVFYRGTAANAPNPLASDLLTAWWLTPEAQTLIAAQGQPGLMPGAPPVPGQPPLSEIKINKGPAFDAYAAYTKEGQDTFRRVFN
ncbi:ABC transporter substrate-binding protein [Microlunatus sp. GCM10028923]|uniref:ABC transporter substrate-binding protein n=1 Tax=Microlunatus sp. GCM10028923 TaxID=3273400 RepID=UPI003609EA10